MGCTSKKAHNRNSPGTNTVRARHHMIFLNLGQAQILFRGRMCPHTIISMKGGYFLCVVQKSSQHFLNPNFSSAIAYCFAFVYSLVVCLFVCCVCFLFALVSTFSFFCFVYFVCSVYFSLLVSISSFFCCSPARRGLNSRTGPKDAPYSSSASEDRSGRRVKPRAGQERPGCRMTRWLRWLLRVKRVANSHDCPKYTSTHITGMVSTLTWTDYLPVITRFRLFQLLTGNYLKTGDDSYHPRGKK